MQKTSNYKLEYRAKRPNKRSFQGNAIKGKGEKSDILSSTCNIGKDENRSTWFVDTYYDNHSCVRKELYSK